MTSMPGKSVSRCSAIRLSSGTNVFPSPTGRKRGSISFGTFTRAKVSCAVCGSRTSTASDSDRFEMYGNGRPSPTASGVRTGKIWRRKRSLELLAVARVDVGARLDPDPVLRERRAAARAPARSVWRRVCSRTVSPIAAIVSAGLRPSSRGRSIPPSTYSCMPATRTMKNSSRLDE